MTEEFLKLLKDLIALKSVSKDKKQVCAAEHFMADFLTKRGVYCQFETIDGRDILYASAKPGKVQDLLLNAHMDVVPVVDEKQFEPYEENGILYGRGTHDCLGNAVCIAEFLCRNVNKLSVGAVFTGDEEIGGFTTAGMVKLGYGAKKAALVLDAGEVVIGQKGMMSMILTMKGKGGHASAPWALENPIDKLMDGYLKLRESWKNPTPEAQWSDSMAICQFHSGFAHNQVPDEAELWLNVRYVEDSHRDEILNKVKTLTGADVRFMEECPPVYADENDPVVKSLVNIYAEEWKQAPRAIRMNGATDARHLKKLGVPVCISGVKGFGCHSVKEGLYLDSVEKTLNILQKFTESL